MMLQNKYNHPPYEFCDGGDEAEETPEEKGGATQTVELPKIIKVGYTDPVTGEKTVKELDISEIDSESLVNDIQKGHFMDKRIGDERKKYKTLEDKVRELAAQRGPSVEDVVKTILDKRKETQEPIVDLQAVKDGDASSLVEAYKYSQSQISKLQKALETRDKKDQEKEEYETEISKMATQANDEIDRALNDFPDLKKDEDKFVNYVKRLRLNPVAIYPLAEIISELSKVGIDYDKLSPEKKKEIEAKVKDELTAPPPPPEGGAGKPPSEEDKVPTDYDGMDKRADEILKKLRSG